MNKLNFILLQFVLAFVLVISLTVNTFSWATRPETEGTDLKLNFGTQINGNSVIGSTYIGGVDENNGRIIYEDEAVTSHITTDAVEGKIVYFKTVLTNTSTVATNISLLLKSIALTGGASIKIGVSSPTKECFSVTAEAIGSGWIPVINTFEVPAGTIVSDGDESSMFPSTSEILWYVEFLSAGSLIIDSFNVVYG